MLNVSRGNRTELPPGIYSTPCPGLMIKRSVLDTEKRKEGNRDLWPALSTAYSLLRSFKLHAQHSTRTDVERTESALGAPSAFNAQKLSSWSLIFLFCISNCMKHEAKFRVGTGGGRMLINHRHGHGQASQAQAQTKSKVTSYHVPGILIFCPSSVPPYRYLIFLGTCACACAELCLPRGSVRVEFGYRSQTRSGISYSFQAISTEPLVSSRIFVYCPLISSG
jgi:hypothetical protein